MVEDGRYLAAHTVSDVWICYPWEATYVKGLLVEKNRADFTVYSDIDEHDGLAMSQSKK